MIPKVREWKITLEDGRIFRVLAPTRRLAILNLRADPRNWGSIVSVGAYRYQSGTSQLVSRVTHS